MKRQQLSKKDVKEINSKLEERFGVQNFIDKKSSLELIDDKFLKVDNEIVFFYLDDEIVPTLKQLLKENFLKKITVDMGAVKFVVKGADIMRPGITEIEEGIKKDSIIVVVDENNQKPLAVGRCLLGSEEIKESSEGKVIKNLHYVGDEIWNS